MAEKVKEGAKTALKVVGGLAAGAVLLGLIGAMIGEGPAEESGPCRTPGPDRG
jgi:hypothetical protein